MKEATGELNMTVITVVAIAAVAAFFYAFVWPMIQRTIVERTCQTYGPEYHATKDNESGTCVDADEISDSGNEKTSQWYCCVSTGGSNGGSTGGGQ